MQRSRSLIAVALFPIVLVACSTRYSVTSVKSGSMGTVGTVNILADEAEHLFAPGAEMQILADGFVFSEGPVWMPAEDGGSLLFTDIEPNTVYKWKDGEGLSIYLRPSGYTGTQQRGGEPGANGLVRDAQGRLVLCEHGDRRVTRLDDPHRVVKTVLADNYQGKRLNSPNDAAYRSNGDLYFTDPPYGLEGSFDDPKKELDFQGVFLLKADGTLKLASRELDRPNGLILSPDEKTLYVANSDPDNAVWWAFDVHPDGALSNGRLFYDVTDQKKEGKPGLPDGMTVDTEGYVYATGPGGLYIFTPEAKLVAMIDTGFNTGNCTFGDDGRTLYVCVDRYLCRLRMRAKGLGF